MPATVNSLTALEVNILKEQVAPTVRKVAMLAKQRERIVEAERQLATVTAALPAAQAKHNEALRSVAIGIEALQNANQAADDTKLALDEVIQTQGVLTDQVRAQKNTLKILETE